MICFRGGRFTPAPGEVESMALTTRERELLTVKLRATRRLAEDRGRADVASVLQKIENRVYEGCCGDAEKMMKSLAADVLNGKGRLL